MIKFLSQKSILNLQEGVRKEKKKSLKENIFFQIFHYFIIFITYKNLFWFTSHFEQ